VLTGSIVRWLGLRSLAPALVAVMSLSLVGLGLAASSTAWPAQLLVAAGAITCLAGLPVLLGPAGARSGMIPTLP